MTDPTPTATPNWFGSESNRLKDQIELGPDPYGIHAIYTGQEAISLTLETQLPSGFTPTQVEVRLVTQATLFEKFIGVAAGDYEPTLGPAWLVGVLGSGLTNADILYPSTIPGIMSNPPQTIEGAYFAWDANSSQTSARGLLTATGPRSMQTITGFVDAVVTIAIATDVPWLDITPEPTP